VTFEPAATPLGDAQILHEEGISASFSQAGTYVLRLTAFDGALSASDEVTVVVQPAGGAPQVLERSVASGADDAEEKAAGSVDLVSSDLELVYDGGIQTIGLRFTGIAVPQGATITNAWIQFMADEAQSEATSLTLYGQDADNAAGFTTATRNISLRPKTTASASWTPAPWTVGAAGAEQRTPDLSQMIQAIVGRPGWASGNALAVVITGTGHRTAEPFEGSSAPLLHLEYLPAGPAATAAATQSPSPEGPTGSVPGVTRLAAVFPNPGPGSATMRFELAREAEVSLDIYDIRGALVRSLVSGRMSPGVYTESWDGRDRTGRRMANGVYLLRFAADRHREMRKLVVLEKR